MNHLGTEPKTAMTNLRALTVGALVVAAFILAVALEEEPYHIDELRQTRSYTLSLREVVDRSFAQDQPPLDPVLNSLAQRVLGEGDWQQRFLSIVFAVAGYVLFATLGYRTAMRHGAPYGVMILAFSPLLISVFAYARPYALPFFLIMALLVTIDIWLQCRRAWSGFVLTITALLLPLSRTIEPNLALAGVVIVLIVQRLRKGREWSEGSVWLPVGAAIAGIAGIGLPVFLRLQSQLTAYTDEGVLPSREQWLRLVTDLPEGLARAVPLWPVPVLVVILAMFDPAVRSRLKNLWWFWVVAFVSFGFTGLFVLTTDPAQPLFDRYFFTWIPLFAVIVTAVMQRASEPEDGRHSLRTAAAIGCILTIVAFSAWTAVALSTKERGDWNKLSETIEAATSPDTVVVFESITALGQYRTPYAGQPRYLDPSWSAPLTLEVIRNPSVIGPATPFVLAISGPPVTAAGWYRVEVDEFFSLYLPQEEAFGPIQAADALVSFGRQFDLASGSALMLAGAALYGSQGELNIACSILEELRGETWIRVEVDQLVANGDASTWADSC